MLAVVGDVIGMLGMIGMQGRRAAAVRTIDQRLGKTQEGHFYERKVGHVT